MGGVSLTRDGNLRRYNPAYRPCRIMVGWARQAHDPDPLGVLQAVKDSAAFNVHKSYFNAVELRTHPQPRAVPRGQGKPPRRVPTGPSRSVARSGRGPRERAAARPQIRSALAARAASSISARRSTGCMSACRRFFRRTPGSRWGDTPAQLPPPTPTRRGVRTRYFVNVTARDRGLRTDEQLCGAARRGLPDSDDGSTWARTALLLRVAYGP